MQIHNPFGARIFYKDMVTSTMDEARLLKDEASGTVIAAGDQSAGRGRMGRSWKTMPGEGLFFTMMLRYGKIPPCLTLRAGLAVSLAIEDFAAQLCGLQTSPLAKRVWVKWPNDIMLLDKGGQGRKAAGILTEASGVFTGASGGTVYLGMGINIAQQKFPPELEEKACSIAQALSGYAGYNCAKELAEKRFTLLEMVLLHLYRELNIDDYAWRQSQKEKLEKRLYMKGQKVQFIPVAESPQKIEGILQGIGEDGEIIITEDSGTIHSFFTGEIKTTI